jgi:hypothetical protein
MEAFATSHYWAHELGALVHTVRLIPPSYVKPYVRREKTTPLTPRQADDNALERPVEIGGSMCWLTTSPVFAKSPFYMSSSQARAGLILRRPDVIRFVAL